MAEIHIFGQKMSFFKHKNIFLFRKILIGQNSIEMIIFMERIIYLVKIDKNYSDGCVRSEHVLCACLLLSKPNPYST